MITYDQIITEIRRLAAEFPDRTADCMYINIDLTPCCGVGQAVVNLGVSAAELSLHNTGQFSFLNLLHLGIEDLPYGSPKERWVRLFQAWQDRGNTWSKSVTGADSGLYPTPADAPNTSPAEQKQMAPQ